MIDLLISPCGQLLTLAGSDQPRRGEEMNDLGRIDNAAVGINLETGIIEYAGPADKVNPEMLAHSCPVVDAGNYVVMPGFVDSHTHLVFGGSRADEFFRRARGESYQSIAASGGGIRKTMAHTRNADPVDMLKRTRWRLHRLYENGTTTVETKSGYGLTRVSELQSLDLVRKLQETEPGLILSTYMGAHLVPPEHKDSRDDYIDEVIATLDQVAQDGLADFYDIFVDPLAFTQQEAQRIVDAGKETDLGLRLHADEFGDDGTAAWGVREGALSVDHLGGVGREGIEAIANSSTIATLLPATMFFSGHGEYAPAREMIEAGCAVALASDLNPGSSLVYSMPFTMTLAALKMKLSAEECIVAATINGAHALGIASLVGSIEVGKRADIIILAVPHYEEIPYHVGCNIVRDVFIRGRIVKSKGNMALATQNH